MEESSYLALCASHSQTLAGISSLENADLDHLSSTAYVYDKSSKHKISTKV